ncbi:tRNA (adenosine(37)-N6)-dimethylallyltransferase MiaA [Desulfopila sp. IMCC35008]|uniref:tRNA (adenosine(37)-N6)-dimethylallyltransferase MiaA n=1 Tax=Desulfopila sp. IMCC35008 TaxID=2653858 RepID=UPI0013D1B295|nr:tRNA (adenosine(37)-N6)-dimethylallyltransferase MiaA [Desulfopila sp. IMCC35008]
MAQKEFNNHPPQPVVAIVGPTAIGKTSLSIDIAQEFNCEIIGVDSMQVYKLMDIGTAKITSEEMEGVPHHLIDILYPDEDYDAAGFVRDASVLVDEITERGRIPLMVGGTGLYLKSFKDGLFEGIQVKQEIRKQLKHRVATEGANVLHEELQLCDHVSAERVHPNDTSRIIRGLEIFQSTGVPWSTHLARQASGDATTGSRQGILIIGLTCERELLYRRINMRTNFMIDQGLEGEVRSLLEMGYKQELKSMGSIGYRHMIHYLKGDWTKSEMMELLARDTRRYAKRQYTWFKKMEGIEWFDFRDNGKVIERVRGWLNENHGTV